ncbi:MAG: hypothetical protein FP814_16195 [Desulfobacterium sp.]|nr:hypothetical protein [Desulfobacterium sp.]MBU4038093.1 hypothetical protein [Pseudomonadota bacterium]
MTKILSLTAVLVMTICAFHVNAGELSPEFNHAAGIRQVEIGGMIVWLCLFAFFLKQSMRERTLSFWLLLFIGCTTMGIQDTYTAWGGYLLYNTEWTMMPWGPSKWTSPYKPWNALPAYGYFFTFVFFVMFRLLKKLRTAYPNLGLGTAVLIVGLPIFYAWDLFVEGASAYSGHYSYVDFVGPAIVTSRGNMPLLYPALLFVVWGVFALWVLAQRSDDGRVKFESWFPIKNIQNSISRGFARIAIWILMINALYLFAFTIPIVLIREFFGMHSVLVP